MLAESGVRAARLPDRPPDRASRGSRRERPPRHPDRLKHIAALGVAGRGLSFYAAQLPLPTEPIRVELTGPDDAAQRIRRSARDFCLRITQRRALDETSLAAIGEDARTWLENARVFL
ncbi:hypothetical protein [Amycolatopsis echigonensis]|uniref:hypothetical protein n=1 Tax=Amycolatopsis echigonensis TaxID=2576905 RepID=UPI001FC9DD49|nr:hypothetical protein [Amycolatopsis niigatensis]